MAASPGNAQCKSCSSARRDSQQNHQLLMGRLFDESGEPLYSCWAKKGDSVIGTSSRGSSSEDPKRRKSTDGAFQPDEPKKP